MIISQLKAYQYRNIAAADFSLSRSLTVLYGDNGQGKTNLLESIFLLGSIRPFRSVKIPHLIMHGCAESSVRGVFERNGSRHTLVLGLKQNQRRVLLDNKVVHNPAELHGKLLVTVFAPDEIAIIRLGPDQRRRYVDRLLYSLNRTFLDTYHHYYRTLKQRNAVLKSGSYADLDIWDRQLATAGCALMVYRSDYIQKLSKKTACYYRTIAGGHEDVSLSYSPALDFPEHDSIPCFLEALTASREQDIRLRATSCGPHKDDILFRIGGHPLKSCGSQGQHRSFILAMKLAEIELLEETFGESPILLLDDITSELDRKRLHNLLTIFDQKGIQVVVTTTDPNHFASVPQQDVAHYKIVAGSVHHEDVKDYE